MITGVERIGRQLEQKSVDRIGVYEHFWPETKAAWERQGVIPHDCDLDDFLNLDMSESWAFDLMLKPNYQNKIIAEDADTVTLYDGNGATLRRHKLHASTPEHIGYAIADKQDWLDKAKPYLTVSPERIKFAEYREAMRRSRDKNRYFVWSGVNVFEAIHPICGHENLLMGMALDPDWIKDMAETYAGLMIDLWEELFAAEGKPDALWFYEDMGFKNRPFMSPEMYRELIMPSHRKTIDYAHNIGCKVIMHSCGFVEPLLPSMIEAGIDCFQTIEVKAGMDLLQIYRNYGDKIALMGGIDVRPLAANDLPAMERELRSKIPLVKGHNNFILHTDHSVPESTLLSSYQKFQALGLELGRY